MKRVSDGIETVIYISVNDVWNWKLNLEGRGNWGRNKYSSLINKRIVLKYLFDFDKGWGGFNEVKVYEGKREVGRYNKREMRSLLNFYNIA